MHVPLECQLTATQYIGELLEPPNFFSPNRISKVTDRLLFTPPEKMMSSTDEEALKYRRLVGKQDDYNQELVAHLEVDITVDIDKKIQTREGRLLTLREMILQIKVHKAGETKGMSLFQSIDFTPNASKLYFNGRQGPGCAGHVFSFYNMVCQEAVQMIRGLGIYLLRMYGSSGIRECFSNSYWKGLKGWKWLKTYECFDRPESRQLHSNVCHDPNQIAGLLEKRRFEKKRLEEQKQEEEKKKNEEEKKNAEDRMKEQLENPNGENEQRDEEKMVDEEREEEEGKDSDGKGVGNDMETPSQEGNEEEGESGETDDDTYMGELGYEEKEEGNHNYDGRKEINDKEEEQMSEGSQNTTLTEVLNKNKIENMKKRDDQDLDSEGGERAINEIVNDDASVTSSLTTGTADHYLSDDEVSDNSSIVSLDSMNTFGAETTNRTAGVKTTTIGAKSIDLTKEFFNKMWKPGMTREAVKKQATNYINKCATRAFQESTAAYQAAFDEIAMNKSEEQEKGKYNSIEDDEGSIYSFDSNSTNKTENLHKPPTGSVDTGKAP